MLTVLVRYEKSRREVLISATSVEFIPLFPDENESGLLINRDDQTQMRLTRTHKDDPDVRDVFVMNAAGSTVAKYKI